MIVASLPLCVAQVAAQLGAGVTPSVAEAALVRAGLLPPAIAHSPSGRRRAGKGGKGVGDGRGAGVAAGAGGKRRGGRSSSDVRISVELLGQLYEESHMLVGGGWFSLAGLGGQ
jgi:hypothetical protein